MGCFFSIHEALDGRKCLRRLEDTDFPCDKSSNPDKEERISEEAFSNTKNVLKGERVKRAKPRLRVERIRDPNELSYRYYKRARQGDEE